MRDETTLSPCVLPLQHSHGYRAVEQDTGTFTSQVTNYIWICLGLETQIKINKKNIFVQHYDLIVYAELDGLDSWTVQIKLSPWAFVLRGNSYFTRAAGTFAFVIFKSI